MTYMRSDFRVNPHDTELIINRILKQLLSAETWFISLRFFQFTTKSTCNKRTKSDA